MLEESFVMAAVFVNIIKTFENTAEGTVLAT